MKKYNVGLQIYSVRNDLKNDFEGTLKKVAEMGYEYVELAGYYGGHTGEEIKEILDRYGLKSISVHQGADMFIEQGQAAFDFFKAYGVKYIVIPWYDKNLLPGNPDWEKTKMIFAGIAYMAKENGMKLLYHNHDFEFEKKIDGEYAYDVMFSDLKGRLDPEPDLCWLNYGGVNPAEYLRKYAGRVKVVHFKDFVCSNLKGGPVYALIDKDGNAVKPSKNDTGFCMKPVGYGCQDWNAIMSACEDTDVETIIVEQDDFEEGLEPLEGVRQSREYLRKTFNI